MRWPRWLRRARCRDTEPQDTAPDPGDNMITPSDAALRAGEAARAAAVHLQESRDRAGEVDLRATRNARLTRDNHFADLIRNALRSGT